MSLPDMAPGRTPDRTPDRTPGMAPGRAPDMDCGCVRDHLDEFIDHQIDHAARAAIESHLRGCHGCNHEVDVESLVKELVARSCRETAPDDLRTRVVAQLFSWRIEIDWPH